MKLFINRKEKLDPDNCPPGLYLVVSSPHGNEELRVKMYCSTEQGVSYFREQRWINLEGTHGFNSPKECYKVDILLTEEKIKDPASARDSAVERIAMKALLLQWLDKGIKTFSRPGGWEYDIEAAELVETTAELFGIERPWDRKK